MSIYCELGLVIANLNSVRVHINLVGENSAHVMQFFRAILSTALAK